jgi:hypothetical protein
MDALSLELTAYAFLELMERAAAIGAVSAVRNCYVHSIETDGFPALLLAKTVLMLILMRSASPLFGSSERLVVNAHVRTCSR